jgi:hypothetical protein
MNRKIENFLKYGIHQDLAIELISKGLNVTTLKSTSVKNLVEKYNLDKIISSEIKKLVNRIPIKDEVLNELLLNNNFTCCCCLGDKGQTIIVHHIVEYEITQDNSYENLAVLCPTCHDLVHSKRALTLTITEKQLRNSKLTWEENCKNKRNNFEIKKELEPIVESWISEYEIQNEDFCSEYFFDLGLFISDKETYGHFTITYLNRGNMFMAGEFKHEKDIVDADIEVSYWGMQWGIRVTKKKIFKAIINYGFNDEIHIINFNSENDSIPYNLILKKEIID